MNKLILAKEVIKWFLFCFLFFISNGCINNSGYEKNISINKYLWDYQQVPEFKIHVQNTNQYIDVFLNLRHTSMYKYSNLSLLIEEIDPKNQVKKYHLELQLSDSDGRWRGVGAGNILSHQLRFIENHLLADTGTYVFKVKQNMSINPLPEIVDVGIKIINGKVIASD